MKTSIFRIFRIRVRRRRVVRGKLRKNHADFVKYKDQALSLAKSRIEYYNTYYNFKFNRISIKNAKTRWGSCSRKGNLNFNYRVAILPPHLLDYIIVHELCHLGQFDHSKDFWNLVGKTIPEYSKARRELLSIKN